MTVGNGSLRYMEINMEVKLKFLREVEKVYDISVEIDWKDIEAWLKKEVEEGNEYMSYGDPRNTGIYSDNIYLVNYDDLLKSIWESQDDKEDHESNYPEVDWETDGSITFKKFLELEDTEEKRSKYYFDNYLELFISENDSELLFWDNCQNIDGSEEEGGLEVIKDAVTLRTIRREKTNV